MKSLFSIFLTLVLLLNSYSNLIVYFSFKINQKEIAKTLCVLREQKNNTCDGNCVLNTELKKNSEKEEKNAFLWKEKGQNAYINNMEEYLFANLFFLLKINCFNLMNEGKTKSRSFKIFHPPIL